jgi:hypothetical protein
MTERGAFHTTPAIPLVAHRYKVGGKAEPAKGVWSHLSVTPAADTCNASTPRHCAQAKRPMFTPAQDRPGPTPPDTMYGYVHGTASPRSS